MGASRKRRLDKDEENHQPPRYKRSIPPEAGLSGQPSTNDSPVIGVVTDAQQRDEPLAIALHDYEGTSHVIPNGLRPRPSPTPRPRTYMPTSVCGNARAQLGDQVFQNGAMFFNSPAVNITGGLSRGPVDDNTAVDVLLESLRFDLIADRSSQIPDAHFTTFKWNHDPAYSNYREWLRDPESRMFWIKGRPGAGKSTLMKCLSSHSLIEICLGEHLAGQELVIARCFLWSAGADLQKSFSGFLRSLLYDLLQACPDLCRYACPRRWSIIKAGRDVTDDWSKPDLSLALKNVLTTARDKYYIICFIDGLDEFEGTYQQRAELNGLLSSLTTSTPLKICTSSRPWPLFEDNFAACPSLALHELTQNDIISYIDNHFLQSEAYKSLRALDPEGAEQLVQDITTRSEGVFLWVSLVVEDLLRALQAGCSLSGLQYVLEVIPPDLHAYFRRMWDSIEPEYERQACALMLVTTRMETVFLPTLSFIKERDVDFETLLPVGNDVAFHAMQQLFKRVIETRCKGFLQTGTVKTCGKLRSIKVTFLHRTARDFLLESEMQMRLRSRAFQHFDVEDYSFRAIYTQLASLQHENGHDFVDLVTEYMDQLQKFWKARSKHVDEADGALKSFLDRHAHSFALPTRCHNSHSIPTIAVLANWRETDRPLSSILRTHGLRASDNEFQSPLLTCPYFVRAQLDCWAGRGPCYCFHPSSKLSSCRSWCDVKVAYFKQHLLRVHAYPKFMCQRCGGDFKNDMGLDSHSSQRPRCVSIEIKGFWKMSRETPAKLGLRAPNRFPETSVEYWFRVYTTLFPDSPLPPSPNDTKLWRHKPGTGGREYVRDFDVFNRETDNVLFLEEPLLKTEPDNASSGDSPSPENGDSPPPENGDRLSSRSVLNGEIVVQCGYAAPDPNDILTMYPLFFDDSDWYLNNELGMDDNYEAG